jgi:hypothetical protein
MSRLNPPSFDHSDDLKSKYLIALLTGTDTVLKNFVCCKPVVVVVVVVVR